MKIKSIQIENFHGFKKFSASFHDRLTVIVGANGAGKSSLLDAISVAAGTFLTGFDGVSGSGISKHDAMNVCYDMGSVVDLQPQFPVRIQTTGIVDGRDVLWSRELNSSDGRTTIVNAKPILSIAEAYQTRLRAGDKTLILPVISYYGTGRLWAQKKEKNAASPIGSFSRLVGYTDCLAAESNEKLMLKWFEKMTIQEAQNQTTSPEFSAVKQAVSKCYQSITGYSDVSAQYNLDTHGIDILFSEADGTRKRYPMNDLSDGYKNTISMIADIAYRMAVLNPQLLGKTLEKTPGVIMIDEVDLHLHPIWQQRILGDLCKLFPSVQFIVSTHAPSVISSVRKENLLILSDMEQGDQPTEETYGSDVNSILTSVMDASERPLEIKKSFSVFYDAVSEGQLQEAERILDEIEQKIGPNDAELTSARVTLNLEKM